VLAIAPEGRRVRVGAVEVEAQPAADTSIHFSNRPRQCGQVVTQGADGSS
jgi:hypothetical protein